MKFNLSAFGLKIEAGFDRAEFENQRIDRAARALIHAEQRKAEIDARAAIMREQEAERRAAIAVRVAELKAASAADSTSAPATLAGTPAKPQTAAKA
jgi:hypothetical protein